MSEYFTFALLIIRHRHFSDFYRHCNSASLVFVNMQAIFGAVEQLQPLVQILQAEVALAVAEGLLDFPV